MNQIFQVRCSSPFNKKAFELPESPSRPACSAWPWIYMNARFVLAGGRVELRGKEGRFSPKLLSARVRQTETEDAILDVGDPMNRYAGWEPRISF